MFYSLFLWGRLLWQCCASVAQRLDVILNKGQFLPQGALGHMGKTDKNK